MALPSLLPSIDRRGWHWVKLIQYRGVSYLPKKSVPPGRGAGGREARGVVMREARSGSQTEHMNPIGSVLGITIPDIVIKLGYSARTKRSCKPAVCMSEY